MKKYDKGAGFEREIKKKLESEGFFVVRSAGSKSKVDLVAIRKNSPPLMIQCRVDGKLSELEREELSRIATQFGGVAVLALKEERKLKLVYLEDGRVFYSGCEVMKDEK